jgi:hypothetical protein
MALVRLAPEPPPLRSSVTKALAEFRRTHEEAGLNEVGVVWCGGGGGVGLGVGVGVSGGGGGGAGGRVGFSRVRIGFVGGRACVLSTGRADSPRRCRPSLWVG